MTETGTRGTSKDLVTPEGVALQAAKENLIFSVSPDGFRAYLTCRIPPDEAGLTCDDIVKLVQDSGILFGLREDLLQSALRHPLVGEPTLIAEGVTPVAGTDGWIDYLVETAQSEKALEESGGKVDLHELHLIHNVLKGQKLATIHPPNPGKPGILVSGKTVKAKDGKKAPLWLGPNVAYDPNDPATVVATADGNVVLRGLSRLEVQPTITIRGNVDYSTGNIDFVGSLIVLGDIKSDFIVKVRKDLEVRGNIEDAKIDVGGDATAHRGFIGYGRGRLFARGNVKVQHLVNQTVISEKDVYIGKESVTSTVKASGKILAPKATIVGGLLEADHEVEVRSLGNGERSRARVRVGRRGRILRQIAEIEKETKRTEKQLRDVKDGILGLIRMKRSAGFLGEEKEERLEKLLGVQEILPQRLEEMRGKQLDLRRELLEIHEAKVLVHDAVHENVLIEINNVKILVESVIRNVVFLERNGLIETRAARSFAS